MAAGKFTAAGLALMLALPVGLVSVVAVGSADAGCLPSASGLPVAGLDAEQSGNARLVVAVGVQRRVPEPGLLVALMAALQESRLRNLPYGDRDSLGLFQQRPSAGWGTPAQLLDPTYAAAAFYGGPSSPAPNPGLLDIPSWESLPLAVAAQAVQRSAFPEAYARWEPAARAALGQIGAGTGAGCTPMTASAAAVVAAAARWVGTPYSWGGGDAHGPTLGVGSGAGTVGFDCSGLTLYAYAQVGVVLPHSSRAQWDMPGLWIGSLAEVQPGDLLFFASNPADPATIHHAALSAGADAMLEAPDVGPVRAAHLARIAERLLGRAVHRRAAAAALRLMWPARKRCGGGRSTRRCRARPRR